MGTVKSWEPQNDRGTYLKVFNDNSTQGKDNNQDNESDIYYTDYQWQKNIDKPSAEIPTTVDQNPGGPRIYSGGREEGHMNQQIKAHNELARKIIAKYPEVTHFGFN